MGVPDSSMYESEVNVSREHIDQVPASALEQFAARNGRLLARTVLPWGEHCTECVWPTCYTSCEFYSPREDRKCRRFVDGMVRLDFSAGSDGYLLKIRFKRWGKLWAAGNIHLLDLESVRKRERWDQRIGNALYHITLPAPLKQRVLWQRGAYKRDHAKNKKPSAALPDLFLVECYNPNAYEISVTLVMRPFETGSPLVFQQLLVMKPGFNRIEIPFSKITAFVDLSRPFHVELAPNDISDGTALYFGIMDFVKVSEVRSAANPVKCVVWDLDGTMWDGTLVEDGAEKLALKSGMREVVQELDRRGILQSVASKNHFEESMAVLKKFGLDQYFLYPQISWEQPKSSSISTIAKELNIGLDAVLFVDDSEFELAQVRWGCPGVRTLSANKYASLLEMKECDLPVTAESSQRRSMYRQEAVRRTAAQTFSGDYFEFLRDCQLSAIIEPLTPANLERVHELTQRTNQMNFSGNRYRRDVLQQMLNSETLDLHVLHCQDRFGSYGVVGFAVVDKLQPRITDLMFSCRIQGKRVEHAFLTVLLKRYISQSGKDLFADYRKTERNAPAGRVFEDLGFEKVGKNNGVATLVFRKHKPVHDDDIVQVVMKGAS